MVGGSRDGDEARALLAEAEAGAAMSSVSDPESTGRGDSGPSHLSNFFTSLRTFFVRWSGWPAPLGQGFCPAFVRFSNGGDDVWNILRLKRIWYDGASMMDGINIWWSSAARASRRSARVSRRSEFLNFDVHFCARKSVCLSLCTFIYFV